MNPTQHSQLNIYFPHQTTRPVAGATLSRQQSARAMYSMLKFIKSKCHLVLTDEHLAELVRTALTTYQPNFNNLATYPKLPEIKCFVLETETLLKVS
jgi:hypothetical protein